MSGNFGLGSSDRPNFESSFLISQQKSLRLRHLSQIAACNLKYVSQCIEVQKIELQNDVTDSMPEKCGYYFTIAIKSNIVLYTSELVNDVNPCWLPFDLDNVLAAPVLSAKGCIVRIWFRDENSEGILVLSWAVNFSGLVSIGKKIYNISPHMSSNTVILRMKEMLYTSPDCRFRTELPEGSRTRIPMYHVMPLPSSEVKAGSLVSSMCRLHSLQRSKAILQQRIDELRNDLENYGIAATSDRNILLQKVERSRLMVAKLSERLEREIAKLRSLKNVHDQIDTEIEEKSMLIFDLYHAFNHDLSSFQKSEVRVEGRASHLKGIIGRVHQRRMYLLRQLPIIFPITHDNIHKDKMYICNVHLPEADCYGYMKDSNLNVAFGFVAQLLVAVSNLVNIPLRFPITFFGSSSSITDWTVAQAPGNKSFALHSRGKEKMFFDYAVYLLNKNIAQLRWTCGLATPNLRPTLFNIWTLLNVISNPESLLVTPDVSLKSPLTPISLDSILGDASLRHISGSSDSPSNKYTWIKDNRCSYSRKYEHWKATSFDLTKKYVDIESSRSLDSGLHLIRKQEESISFLQLDIIRRTKSCNSIADEMEQLVLDDYIPTVPEVAAQTPEYVDGLNESDRKTIDESFELVKNKYFLKRSNSIDRLAKLNTTVSLSPRRRSEEIEVSERVNGVQEIDSDVAPNLTEEDVKDSNSQVEEAFPEAVSEAQPAALLKVFSRTSALANQNFSFKYSNRRSDSS